MCGCILLLNGCHVCINNYLVIGHNHGEGKQTCVVFLNFYQLDVTSEMKIDEVRDTEVVL